MAKDINDQTTRRSMLKKTGAALGATALVATSANTASATQLCLEHDWVTHPTCPPSGEYGAIVERGAMAYEACVEEDVMTGEETQYYWVHDGSASGYVTEGALVPCSEL